MNQVHVAASGPKAREIVEVVLEEFDRWFDLYAVRASMDEKRIALDVRADLMDHLVIPIGSTLASWGISDE